MLLAKHSGMKTLNLKPLALNLKRKHGINKARRYSL
jgi:hypothetical protein